MKNYCEMGADYAIEKAKELNLSEDVKRLIENAYADGARAVNELEGMSLRRYQEQAMTTCMESSDNFSYMFLNLVGEVGEFASKVAKGIRKGHCSIGLEPNIADAYDTANETTANELWQFFGMEERLEELKKEAGDVLWQLSGLCSVMGWSLDDIAQMNLDKLAARKKEGTIEGNGDGITKAERGK